MSFFFQKKKLFEDRYFREVKTRADRPFVRGNGPLRMRVQEESDFRMTREISENELELLRHCGGSFLIVLNPKI